MTVTVLTKGQNVSLSRLMPMSKNLVVGFSWDVVRSNGPTTEIVPFVIACGQDDKAVSNEHAVYFNQLMEPEGSITYEGDGLPGGDAEQVEINLDQVPSNIVNIVFLLYVNPDLRTPGTFDAMRSGKIRILDRAGNEVVTYDIKADIDPSVSAMYACELYRRNGEWKFRAVGQGFAGGVKDVAKFFGLTL